MNGKRHIRLDQGRKLATAIAISGMIILCFIGWQISGASNETASKAQTADTSAESSTEPTADPEPEASEVLEDPNPKNLPAGNICEPHCAEGYRVEAPVTLTVNTTAKPGKRIYLTNLVMEASTEENFADGNRSLTWDLGEFAKMMDSEN